MKRTLIRITGSLCILVALFAALSLPWINICDISKRDLREARNSTLDDLEAVKSCILSVYEINPSDIKDELEDHDLPNTKTGIKKRFRSTETLLESLLDNTISLRELYQVSIELPQYIEDTENLFDYDRMAVYLFEASKNFTLESAKDALNGISEYEDLFIGIKIAIIVFIAIGILSAVCNMFKRGKFVKYIFLLTLLALVIGTCIALPIIADNLDNVALMEQICDMSLSISIMPFITVALTAVPIVLDILFERKTEINIEEA